MGAGIEIHGEQTGRRQSVLNPQATALIAELQGELGTRRAELLERRRQLQREFAEGRRPTFSDTTAKVRAADWRVPEAPADLSDRRVEITGPTDAKMMINALNSGARVFMADLEDANSPTWANMVDGQANVSESVRRALTFDAPDGRHYTLGSDLATLVVRPRGWHLVERHVLASGVPVSASLFDFGVFVANNGAALLERGSGPYLYLAKLEGRRGGGFMAFGLRGRRSPAGAALGEHPRHRAHRDHPGRLRDGRDPVRPRPQRNRAQRRPLGLHLQHYQEVPQ